MELESVMPESQADGSNVSSYCCCENTNQERSNMKKHRPLWEKSDENPFLGCNQMLIKSFCRERGQPSLLQWLMVYSVGLSIVSTS